MPPPQRSADAYIRSPLVMPKPKFIELESGLSIPILYEDRSLLAIDKPAGWMLAPGEWQDTSRNLFAALVASIRSRDFWARSRNLRYLRHVHRLDADTSGVLLLAKSPGALATYSRLFETRQVDKVYLAVVRGQPTRGGWACRLKLASDPEKVGTVKVDSRNGKESETHFQVLQQGTDASNEPIALVLARPVTGRTHQIRVHLAESGHPVLGDALYSPPASGRRPTQEGSKASKPSNISFHVSRLTPPPLALRAVRLSYVDPFVHRRVRILAPTDEFIRAYGFNEISNDAVDQAIRD